MRWIYKILLILTAGMISTALYGQNFFEFNGQLIFPGTQEHFTINLSAGEDQTTIPITVFHGKTEGPVLGITAGVHGYEYAPILAGQILINKIDPEALSGTVILVQIANMGSFLGRSPYLTPADKKNLNRSFPGKKDGSISEKVAHFISQNIIAKSDYFVDMHSGDAPEDLHPYTAYYQHDAYESISEVGREMALHMGFDQVVKFGATQKDYLKAEFPSLYCSAEAFKRGIPAVDIECGKLGLVEQPLVNKIVAGIESLLRYLGMMAGEPIVRTGVLLFEERFYISSEHMGIFYPLKSSGDLVKKGMKLGYITNFFGKVVDEIYAENSGLILYMLGTPPVNEKETLFVIGAFNEANTHKK
ncbi:MAG: M14 family metallopeptidase [Bacteroidota bacterium]